MKRVAVNGPSYDEVEVGGNCQVERSCWYQAPRYSPVLFTDTYLYARRWGSHRLRHHLYRGVALEFIVEGSATFFQDNKKTKLLAGEIFLMRRGHDSGFSTAVDEHYEKMTLCLSGTILDLLVESLHLNEVPKITLTRVEEAKQRFREIRDLLRKKIPGTEQVISEKVFSLFLFLGEENRVNKSRSYPEPLRKALVFLHGTYTRSDVGISALPEIAGVSNPTLIRMFHEYCGKSPMEHLTEMRMELAKNLLESTDLSIKEIAGRVGYNDPLYFSSVFRKFSGMSPRAFRRFSHKE